MLRKFLLPTWFNKPKKLYKYMDVNGASEFFRNPSLWFCLPSRLNDSFDLNPVGSHPAEWSGAAVLCFTETPTSMPMWAHYGENGKGIVLEFSVQSNFFWRYPPMKVSYQSKRPTIKSVEKSLMTKDATWSYEREWRCITSLDFDEYKEQQFSDEHQVVSVPFPFEALTAVIYGDGLRVNFQSAQTFLSRPEASHVQQLVCRAEALRYGLKVCALDDISYLLEQHDAVDWGRR